MDHGCSSYSLCQGRCSALRWWPQLLLEALVEPRCLALCRSRLRFLFGRSLAAPSAAEVAVLIEPYLYSRCCSILECRQLFWWGVRLSAGGASSPRSWIEALCCDTPSAAAASACAAASWARRRISSGWAWESLRWRGGFLLHTVHYGRFCGTPCGVGVQLLGI